jgi:hypothetical protein
MATLANKAQQQFVFQHVSFIIMLLQTVALRAHAGAHTVNACIPVCVYVSENPNRNKPCAMIANAGGICQTRLAIAAVLATDTHRLLRSNRGKSPRSWEGHEGLQLLTKWEPPPCGDLLYLVKLG